MPHPLARVLAPAPENQSKYWQYHPPTVAVLSYPRGGCVCECVRQREGEGESEKATKIEWVLEREKERR